MGKSRYRIYDDRHPYFITSTIVWGISLFSDPLLARVVLDALDFLQRKRDVTLYSYVIMHNHIHMIAQSENLAKKMQRMKSYSARQIIQSMEDRNRTRWLRVLRAGKRIYKRQSTYQVWQEGYHPKKVFSPQVMHQKLNYIHQNPVKAGFVDRPEYWRYSSARDYADATGLIPVTLYE